MTPSPTDSLVFRLAEGEEAIPTDSGSVAFKLLGEGAELIEPEVIHSAAAAVLHYFREDLKRSEVTPAEFSMVLEKVLKNLGFSVAWNEARPAVVTSEADLRELAKESGPGFELVFFQRLRAEVRKNLELGPRVLRFTGLRACVKQMAGARRWTGRCQELHDQIVEHLRQCLSAEKPGQPCGLVVS